METKFKRQPPPLPPKSKKTVDLTEDHSFESVHLNGEYGVLGKINRNTPNASEIVFGPKDSNTKADPIKNYVNKEETRPVKKSFSLNSRKGNGIVGKIASAFSEPSKRSESGFKIITWADKSLENGKMKKVDEEFLYQNVSNSGTNYIEYKLKDIISSKDIQNRKTTIKPQEDMNGVNKVSYKVSTGPNKEKTDSDSSTTWMAATNRQIQVQQVKNKTVVKISMNDCSEVPQQNNDKYFKPLKDDDLSTSEYQYPELLFQKNKPVPNKVNEYAEPFRGHTVQLYANVDLNKKRKNQNDGQIYENTDVAEEESKDGQVYMNVGNGEVYANVDGNSAVPVTEHHYLNVNGAINGTTIPRPAPDDEDQVYENEDFTVLKNSQVTQSIIQKNALPTREEVYENTDFMSKNNVLDDIQFSGPGIKENSGYQTPRSALRLVVNDVDPDMMKTKENYIIQKFVVPDSSDCQYSPSETFDSGTSSDPENSTPIILSSPTKDGKVVVTVNGNIEQEERGGHKRAESITSSGVGVDSEVSDTEESNISCDSLNSNDMHTFSVSEDHGYHTPTSENKTNSPIEGIEYQNVDPKSQSPEPSVEDELKFTNSVTFKIHENSDFESTDIIQQVANAAERLKNLRIENTGTYLARRIESCDDVYENCEFYENSDIARDRILLTHPLSESINSDKESIDGFKTLPKGLLRDIRSNVRALSAYPNGAKNESQIVQPKIVSVVESTNVLLQSSFEKKKEEKRVVINEKTYEERKTETSRICGMELDPDKFYKFHLYEKFDATVPEKTHGDEETFAGFRDYLNRERPAAITSAKGTIRGVKNRVKAGIATFLQLQENKVYKDRDAGKIVVYSTTMGIVRETYQKCLKVKQILKTLMVKFEERDVFMSSEAQDEIRERMKCDAILVPQVFVEGQHIGDAETIDKLNESGELRKILKSYKSADAGATCSVCGGYRLLPCKVCKGSKKSVHRNHFTAEFVSLKCMNCDPVGLMKCYAC